MMNQLINDIIYEAQTIKFSSDRKVHVAISHKLSFNYFLPGNPFLYNNDQKVVEFKILTQKMI